MSFISFQNWLITTIKHERILSILNMWYYSNIISAKKPYSCWRLPSSGMQHPVMWQMTIILKDSAASIPWVLFYLEDGCSRFIIIYWTTAHRIPEGSDFHCYYCENLKSHTLPIFSHTTFSVIEYERQFKFPETGYCISEFTNLLQTFQLFSLSIPSRNMLDESWVTQQCPINCSSYLTLQDKRPISWPCSRILINKWLKFILVLMLANCYKWEQKMAAVEDMLQCPSLQKRFPLNSSIIYCTKLGFLVKT